MIHVVQHAVAAVVCALIATAFLVSALMTLLQDYSSNSGQPRRQWETSKALTLVMSLVAALGWLLVALK